MKPPSQFDFWYAVNNTEIVSLPSRRLETFGTTIFHYHLVTEVMDAVNQTRVREGRMLASRPQIITPEAYSETILDGFGDQARHYVDWLREHEKEIRILQYGYALRKEDFSEHLVSENIKSVVESVQARVRESADPFSAIVVGVDRPWDVCLIKLFWEVIRQSAPGNIRELESRRMFENVGGVPRAVREEIEALFLAASRDRKLVGTLAGKLQEHRLFEEYQDRFFSVVRSSADR